ncbi:MAG: hypothetical protein OIF50_06930 [Flavobacteriaceae bacterium]|nr:hypothetical protein [Flavobacteriaceae bacterium]
MKKILLLLLLNIVGQALGQDRGYLLKGKVMHYTTNVPNENVININTAEATATNVLGEFSIYVSIGDELLFTAVNFEMQRILITAEILREGRLLVQVREKVQELEEVVVSPEEVERLVDLRQEEFKRFYYASDGSEATENMALSQEVKGMQHGVNFVNLFNAIFRKKRKEEGVQKVVMKPSGILKQVYDVSFFTEKLYIPEDKIDAFLFYCDDKLTDKTLLTKKREFEMLDFLIKQSQKFLQETR